MYQLHVDTYLKKRIYTKFIVGREVGGGAHALCEL